MSAICFSLDQSKILMSGNRLICCLQKLSIWTGLKFCRLVKGQYGYVKAPVSHLLFYKCFRPMMRKLLNQGTTLIVDRYAYSGVAFTAAKQVKK